MEEEELMEHKLMNHEHLEFHFFLSLDHQGPHHSLLRHEGKIYRLVQNSPRSGMKVITPNCERIRTLHQVLHQ
ncbi:hypothetical protein PRUPE_4G212000 [Prunus persica]|uniref:Uncharacterized protein n=1 Tax=Prunus persica TaxID=3760 RepID=A0A251PNW3_PRUPE|nr:hypothetical protein PRUPE_4G212000 [Prunus persica]